jgi:hypothetical protein
MCGIGASDCWKAGAKHIKAPSTGGGEAANDNVLKLDRVVALSPHKGKPVKETHVVTADAWMREGRVIWSEKE